MPNRARANLLICVYYSQVSDRSIRHKRWVAVACPRALRGRLFQPFATYITCLTALFV